MLIERERPYHYLAAAVGELVTVEYALNVDGRAGSRAKSDEAIHHFYLS